MTNQDPHVSKYLRIQDEHLNLNKTKTKTKTKNTSPKKILSPSDSEENLRILGDGHAHEIIPGLFLGNYISAISFDEIHKCNITHIVSANGMRPPPYLQDAKTIKYCILKLRDADDEQDIMKHFEEVFEFVHEPLSKNTGGVLIHCFRGVSRSTTLLMAYLIQREFKENPTTDHTVSSLLKLVKTKRPQAGPRSGFMKQLEHFHQKLFPSSSSMTSTSETTSSVSDDDEPEWNFDLS